MLKKPWIKLTVTLLSASTLNNCASSPSATPSIEAALREIRPLPYYYGTPAAPCEDDAGKALPDPENTCDSDATVREIIRMNAKIEAARKAAGLK